MRLVFVLASFVSLILASRWLTLSEDSPFAKAETGFIESADEPLVEKESSVSKIAVAVFDDESIADSDQNELFSHQKQTYPSTSRPLSSAVAPDFSPSFTAPAKLESPQAYLNQPAPAYVGTAKNVKRLVRAEYEISNETAEALSQLESEATLETSIIDTGSSETVILQVTTDEKTQSAISQLLDAISPSARKTRKRGSTTIRANKKTWTYHKTCQKFCYPSEHQE